MKTGRQRKKEKGEKIEVKMSQTEKPLHLTSISIEWQRMSQVPQFL